MRPCTKKQSSIIRHHRRFFRKIFQLFMNTASKIFKNIINYQLSSYLSYQLNDWFQSIISTVSINGLRCIKIKYEPVEHFIQLFINVNEKCR